MITSPQPLKPISEGSNRRDSERERERERESRTGQKLCRPGSVCACVWIASSWKSVAQVRAISLILM